MVDLLSRLTPHLPDHARNWLDEARRRVAREGPTCVPELLPQLPRRIGRRPLGGGILRDGEALADLDAWRHCDAAALVLLAREAAPDDLEIDLFQHGDLEERTMVLRALALLPVHAATIDLLGEVQRTNTVPHFEAAICDSNLAVRAFAADGFGEPGFNRLLLKLAFSDLPLARVLGAEEHANPELSRMLQGLATEREAAGRRVWADTNRMIAHAPTAGTVARLVGHLEHGDDGQRLAAAEGLARLARPELTVFLRERLPREPRAEIRAVLEGAV